MNFKKPEFWDYSGLSLWSIILYPLSILYLFLSFLAKLIKIQKKFSIPIICVGNIYVGGTGKTPLALEIFKIIKSSGKNPAFVKKGYSYLYDEIKMLEKIGKTFSNKNRKVAINSLITLEHNVAILDDGFQDFSIKKDFSIVCFNSKQLIGNGFIIPSGPLRENLGSLKRSDCIIINGEKNIQFEDKIKKINKNINIFYSKYKIKNLENFKNREIIAFAGIGNPLNFFDLLRENNINVKKEYSFPDHHKYTQKDFDTILRNGNTKIVTTEKDFYRMNEKQKLNCEYIEVNLEIENKKDFDSLIKSKI